MAGDVLYVPHNWWHHVESLSDSISINTWVELKVRGKQNIFLLLIYNFTFVYVILCQMLATRRLFAPQRDCEQNCAAGSHGIQHDRL